MVFHAYGDSNEDPRASWANVIDRGRLRAFAGPGCPLFWPLGAPVHTKKEGLVLQVSPPYLIITWYIHSKIIEITMVAIVCTASCESTLCIFLGVPAAGGLPSIR